MIVMTMTMMYRNTPTKAQQSAVTTSSSSEPSLGQETDKEACNADCDAYAASEKPFPLLRQRCLVALDK